MKAQEVQFFKNLEAGPTEFGETPSQWDGGDVSIAGRSGRRQRERDELGPEKGHGLPDHAGKSPTRRSWSPQSERGSEPRVSHRSSPRRIFGGPRGPPNATIEGVGNRHAGAKLAIGETPGANQPISSIPHKHGGKRTGEQDRIEDDEVEERHNEGEGVKVGRRRRRRHKKGSLRDASWEKSQPEPIEGRPRPRARRSSSHRGERAQEGAKQITAQGRRKEGRRGQKPPKSPQGDQEQRKKKKKKKSLPFWRKKKKAAEESKSDGTRTSRTSERSPTPHPSARTVQLRK